MTMYPRTFLFAAALIAATAPLSAQKHKGRHGSADDGRTSRIDTTLSVSRTPTVDLSLISGDIKVTSWDKSEIRIIATSDEGDLRLEASSSRVSLTMDEDYSDGDGETKYEVTVPKGARVIAGSVSGNVSVRGVAEVEATSVSGDVTVNAIAGRATIQSVSGELRASDLGGEVHAQNVSGDLEIVGVAGELSVQTVSGEMKLRGVKSSYVRAETVSGDLEFDGAVDPKGRYEFHSHSGSVTITLPRGAGATISVRGFSGDISSSCEMMLAPNSRTGEHSYKSTTFTIGGGGARFTIETFSGDLQIKGCGNTKSKED
jgi:DUF4097 and DUF4098 domain-containing protein YvlB